MDPYGSDYSIGQARTPGARGTRRCRETLLPAEGVKRSWPSVTYSNTHSETQLMHPLRPQPLRPPADAPSPQQDRTTPPATTTPAPQRLQSCPAHDRSLPAT